MAYQVGDIIEVEVSAIQPYGAFVTASDGYTGLLHISEISSKFVKSVENFVKVGSKIKVKILDVDLETKHLKLSLKSIQRAKEVNYKSKNKKSIDTVSEFNKLKENLPIWVEKILNQQSKN